jgi:DNA-binding transcriptional MerR regulator
LDKSPGAFRTISEVADEIDVPQHVLRFWESRFGQIRPMKRGGGRRFYRPEDVDLLRGVRHLLYGEGYTIRGVQRILREQGAGFVQNVWRAGAEAPPPEIEEDREEDEASDVAEPVRAEPKLSLFPLGAPRARKRDDTAQAPERRAPGVPLPKPSSVLGEDAKRGLQTALDELIECQRLIEAAMSNSGPLASGEGSV